MPRTVLASLIDSNLLTRSRYAATSSLIYVATCTCNTKGIQSRMTSCSAYYICILPLDSPVSLLILNAQQAVLQIFTLVVCKGAISNIIPMFAGWVDAVPLAVPLRPIRYRRNLFGIDSKLWCVGLKHAVRLQLMNIYYLNIKKFPLTTPFSNQPSLIGTCLIRQW